jgi:UMF1 family MFS transporter
VAEKVYVALGLFIGVAAGPLQAASRTLLVRLSPPDRVTQFFGLFALSGKVTSFLGPFLVGVVTAVTLNQKAGMAVLIAFFCLGAALLLRVETKAP